MRENTEAIEKNYRPHSQGLVRPLALGGQTGRAGFEIPDRSDRLLRPVRPVSATGQTAITQTSISALELEVISRLLVQIITNLSIKRINPKHKGSLEFCGERSKKGFSKNSNNLNPWDSLISGV